MVTKRMVLAFQEYKSIMGDQEVKRLQGSVTNAFPNLKGDQGVLLDEVLFGV